jgi:flagellar hook-length control protein FliK
VASNLTVITSTAAGAIAKSLNGQGTPQVKPDVFAALLGETRKPADPPATTSTERAAAASEPPKSSADQDQTDDPQAIAAPIDAVAPIQTTPPPAELKDVLDRLAKLSASIEAGKAPTEQDMADLATALDALAQALGVSLDDLPSTAELTTLANSATATGTSATDQLAKALAPLALSLQGGDAATGVAADADLTLQLAEMGNKLAALAKALSAGDVAPASLAALGMDPASAEIDPDLQAALDKLANATAIKVATAANAQPLATPELKLTESAITGKTAEAKTAEVKTEPTTEPAAKTDTEIAAKPVTGDKPKSDTDPQPGDAKPKDRDVKVAAAPIAPAPDKQPDQAALPQQQTARIDPLLAPRVVQTGYQTSQQQLNLPQLAFEVARQASDGNTRFQIRLDPAELGRIDVRLDIDASGRVNARLTVEKAETLDLMQRDQRGLERALQQAGLDGAKTNLEFSLKQNPFNGGQQGENGNGRPSLFGAGETAAEAEETPAPTINLYRGSLTASGVNILA